MVAGSLKRDQSERKPQYAPILERSHGRMSVVPAGGAIAALAETEPGRAGVHTTQREGARPNSARSLLNRALKTA